MRTTALLATHPKVLVLVMEMGGCELWRTLLPVSELQRQGYQGIEWGAINDGRLAALALHFDAVAIQRVHWVRQHWSNRDLWFRALHRAGLAVIYEVDDDLFSDEFVRRLVELHGYTREDAEERRGDILAALQACDGVTCSTQRVASIVRQHTDKPVEVVGNYIDLPWFRKVQRAHKRSAKSEPGLPTIGWAGGIRADSDVADMAVAWGRIARRYPGIKFVVQGHQPAVIRDQVPEGQLVQLPWMPIDQYPGGLKNIDIGCCSLADTFFNQAKTPIKAMEYAVTGAAVVASPVLYDKLIDDGKDGLIAVGPDEWEQALVRLVEDAYLRGKLARRLLKKIERRYTLQENAWRWLLAWKNIVAEAGEQRRRPRNYLPREVEHAIQ